jgi:hypothetical protein
MIQGFHLLDYQIALHLFYPLKNFFSAQKGLDIWIVFGLVEKRKSFVFSGFFLLSLLDRSKVQKSIKETIQNIYAKLLEPLDLKEKMKSQLQIVP